ncbi:MAG: lipopolysaccharide biosynthesis protein [Pseudomonadota bacterium]|nr:lipopolysaccharide biosynthesis protein [Pseudomonadota bacterium]
MNHSQKIRFGVKWTAIAMVTTQILRFLTTIVLARLLVPELFGLVAMANTVIHIISVIREFGLGSAYIQRRIRGAEDARLAASTTFYVLCMINAVMFVAAWFLAPLAASFFREAVLVDVFRVLILSLVLDAAITTSGVVLQKDMEFGKYAVTEIIGRLSYSLISISLALLGFGVWSLVFGQLGAQIVRTGISIKLSGWRPAPVFSTEIARELFSFGKYLWGFSILSALGDSLDRIIIGRWLGAGTLGVYGLALNLSKLPATQISRMINRIAFPALSRIQDDKAALRRVFRKTLNHVAPISLPVGLALSATADGLVATLYGENWAGAAPVLEVLAIYGTALSLSGLTGPVFKAIGKPNVLLYTSVLHHTLMAVLLIILARYGIVAIAWAVLIPLLVSSAIAFVLVARYLDLQARDLLEPLLRSGSAALIMYLTIQALEWFVGPAKLSSPLLFLACIGVGMLSYLLASLITNRAVMHEVTVSFREVMLARGKLL